MPPCMHRIVVNIIYLTAGVYIASVILRELSILTSGPFPSVSRAIEFGIGTGGKGAATGA